VHVLEGEDEGEDVAVEPAAAGELGVGVDAAEAEDQATRVGGGVDG
jgi:hypothetical protein